MAIFVQGTFRTTQVRSTLSQNTFLARRIKRLKTHDLASFKVENQRLEAFRQKAFRPLLKSVNKEEIYENPRLS